MRMPARFEPLDCCRKAVLAMEHQRKMMKLFNKVAFWAALVNCCYGASGLEMGINIVTTDWKVWVDMVRGLSKGKIGLSKLWMIAHDELMVHGSDGGKALCRRAFWENMHKVLYNAKVA